MSECEGQDCKAKQCREKNYSSDDERWCVHGRNLRHALSVQHARRTNRNVNCQTGLTATVKAIDGVGEKTQMTIRVG
jgi:hypothetical protein